jgi:GH15 family glucan-1,4-alpha-glucosidase
MTGRDAEAKALFDRLVFLRNDVGLFAEQYDVKNNHLTGNFPQACSHVAFINTVHNLTRLSKPSQQRAGTHRPHSAI